MNPSQTKHWSKKLVVVFTKFAVLKNENVTMTSSMSQEGKARQLILPDLTKKVSFQTSQEKEGDGCLCWLPQHPSQQRLLTLSPEASHGLRQTLCTDRLAVPGGCNFHVLLSQS